MRPSRIIKPPIALTLAGAAAALCACGGGGGSDHSPPPPTTTAPGAPGTPPPTSSSPPPPTPAPTTSAPTQGAGGRCHTSDLKARISTAGPAAGQRYAYLTLTNTSGSTCRVHGYVGMLLLSASDHPITTHVERLAPPRPQTVTLRPGGSAHARLHWTVVPGSREPEHGACAPTPQLAWITPPDERAHLVVTWNQGVVCGDGRVSTTPLRPGPAPR